MAKVDYTKVLSRLQYTWILCMGCITALCVIGYWLPHLWMPVAGVVMITPVFLSSKKSIGEGLPHCSLMSHYTVYTLLITSVVMLTINLIHSRWLNSIFTYEPLQSSQFISSVIIYPIGAIVFGIGLLRRNRTEYCKMCRQRAGYSMKEMLEGNLFYSEAKRLIAMAFIMNLLLAIGVWTYYLTLYIDVNINGTDTFFFFVTPFAIYMVSVVYIITTYASMNFEIKMAPGTFTFNTMLRFLVLRDGKILMHELESDGHSMGLWDTPAITTIPYTESENIDTAQNEFEKISGTKDFSIRYLFTTNTSSHNCFHYMVELTSAEENTPYLNGKWMGIYDIDILLRNGKATRPFAYVIHRIFTITMAWKTYNRDGKRLYPIKNYRPTFRLQDFKDWNVDYNDLHWMSIAQNNEDKPLWKIKKFWRKHISSVDK